MQLQQCRVLAAMLPLAACGAGAAPPGVPATAPPVHLEIRDSSVDALPDSRVLVAPDIVLAIVDIGVDTVVFRLRHRPGSFDPATTQLAIELDTDQNASSGAAGVEYTVSVIAANDKSAEVIQTTSAGSGVVGTVPVSIVADGCDVAIPLSLLGHDDGRFDFRVRVYAQPALPVVVDLLPDVGFVRIE